jgi:hypothetical protein
VAEPEPEPGRRRNGQNHFYRTAKQTTGMFPVCIDFIKFPPFFVRQKESIRSRHRIIFSYPCWSRCTNIMQLRNILADIHINNSHRTSVLHPVGYGPKDCSSNNDYCLFLNIVGWVDFRSILEQFSQAVFGSVKEVLQNGFRTFFQNILRRFKLSIVKKNKNPMYDK